MFKKRFFSLLALLLTSISLCAEENVNSTPCDDGTSNQPCRRCPENLIPPESHSVYWHREGDLECAYAHMCGHPGIWFPETPTLFRPFLADPRQITYSGGWRFWDKALSRNVIDVSFGDYLGVYEWCDVWPWHGQMRVEIEGAVWAVFAPCKESSPLINADYYLGIPLTYAIDRWAFRLRGFHVSSHVGDEWLILHPKFRRLNPSAESIDFSVSHEFSDDIRLYGVLGYTFHQDPSFKLGPFYAEAGLELRLRALRFTDYCDKMYGTPFYGMHFRFNRSFKNHVDATYVVGYEWEKFCGLCRKVRFFLEYHDGYSLEGQFAKCPTHYLALRMSYGF